MDAFDVLFTRRSVRSYSADPVTEEEVTAILKAGMLAPSANNGQTWSFLVLRDQKKRDALAEVHPYAKFARQAPVSIFLCGEPARSKTPVYWLQDCSACMENMLLAARALNLGSCWCGIYPRAERIEPIATLFELPDGVIPMGLMIVGHSTQPFFEADRFDSAKIHYERW